VVEVGSNVKAWTRQVAGSKTSIFGAVRVTGTLRYWQTKGATHAVTSTSERGGHR
jgi:hypothetical protein